MEKHIFYIAYIHISTYFPGGIRVQVLKEFNMHSVFLPTDNQIPPR